ITKRSGEPDVISAFETAERAENSKIAGWAELFDFELTEPIVVDLGAKPATDKVLSQIVDTVKRTGTEGIVAASSEYLRRAGLLGTLLEALKKAGKRVWIADLGSLPIEDRISA
ncbi:MAG: hypothetical protein ACREF7_03770, partial [Candidatus Saccharimonadales bacterium]